MGSVTIGANDYFVYMETADADIYLAADPDAATWRALTSDDPKARALVAATRILDRQSWAGDKTDGTDQVNAWPRTDTSIDGVDEDIVPDDIANACAELANAIVNGTFTATTQTTAQTKRRIKAGTVEVEYFRGAEGMAIPFPLPVWQLISPYLGGGASASSLSSSAGVDQCDPLSAGYNFDLGF